MVTKIKEWLSGRWLPAIIIVLSAIWLGSTIWLSILWSSPDQPKMSIAEKQGDSLGIDLDGDNEPEYYIYPDTTSVYQLDSHSLPPFNPATDEIIRVDTVGWGKLWRVIGEDSATKIYVWSANGKQQVDTGVVVTDIYGWAGSLTLDSIIVPKTAPLLDRMQTETLLRMIEENRWDRDTLLLGRSTVKEKK